MKPEDLTLTEEFIWRGNVNQGFAVTRPGEGPINMHFLIDNAGVIIYPNGGLKGYSSRIENPSTCTVESVRAWYEANPEIPCPFRWTP